MTSAIADRIPSRQSAHLQLAMRLTTYPLSLLAPRNATSAYVFRGLVNGIVGRRGVAALEHAPVRARHHAGAVMGEWVPAPPGPGDQILFYIHGSAYVACSTKTHRRLVSRLARRTGRAAFSLEYPLAPEHRFPAAHQAAVAGYLWLLDQGFRAEDIVVAGDSAGGHLALALCGELRRQGRAMPAGLTLMSPLVDASFDTAAAAARRVRDVSCHPRAAKRLLRHYTRGADLTDPRLDVVQEAGADLPPMLIQAGGREMMSADAELFAATQAAAGGSCELQIWPGQSHVFQLFPGLPESAAALDEIAAYVAALDDTRRSDAG